MHSKPLLVYKKPVFTHHAPIVVHHRPLCVHHEPLFAALQSLRCAVLAGEISGDHLTRPYLLIMSPCRKAICAPRAPVWYSTSPIFRTPRVPLYIPAVLQSMSCVFLAGDISREVPSFYSMSPSFVRNEPWAHSTKQYSRRSKA